MRIFFWEWDYRGKINNMAKRRGHQSANIQHATCQQKKDLVSEKIERWRQESDSSNGTMESVVLVTGKDGMFWDWVEIAESPDPRRPPHDKWTRSVWYDEPIVLFYLHMYKYAKKHSKKFLHFSNLWNTCKGQFAMFCICPKRYNFLWWKYCDFWKKP